MISKKLAVELINYASSTGADFVELFYEDTKGTSYSFENAKLDSISTNYVNGIGVRLLKDNQSIYGYTNDLSKKSLFKLIENLRSSFSTSRCIEEISDLKQQKYKRVNKSIVSLTTIEPSTIIEYVRKGINEIYHNKQ